MTCPHFIPVVTCTSCWRCPLCPTSTSSPILSGVASIASITVTLTFASIGQLFEWRLITTSFRVAPFITSS